MQPVKVFTPVQYFRVANGTEAGDMGEPQRLPAAKEEPWPEEETEAEDEDLFELPDDDETFILPAVKHARSRFPVPYHQEISTYMILFLILTGLYVAAAVLQLFSIRQLTELMYHHIPRLDLLPGTFVDDRISFFAIFLAILTARHVVAAAAVWLLQPITQSWKRTLHIIVTSFFLVIDVVAVITLLIVWFLLANKSFMPYTPANDVPSRYCNVYQASYPTRCIPESQTLTAADLHPTTAFYILFITECLFVLFESIYIILNVQLDTAAAEYRYVSALRD